MIWTEQTLTPGHWICQKFGPLTVVILNQHDEWRLCHWLGEAPISVGSGTSDELPDDLTWQRWNCTPEDDRFLIQPTFPDLALIAQPKSPLILSPKSEALFYLGIPAFLDIQASHNEILRSLTTIPTQQLTKTWHGTRRKGDPCYTLRTRARRHFETGKWPSHDIICAVEIQNLSSEDFEFEKLYLETGHLGVFSHGEQNHQLWGNACRIKINKIDSHSHDVTFAPAPLSPANTAQEICSPLKGHTRKGNFKHAFSSFIDSLKD